MLDLRLPMGLMFTIVGGLIVAYGLVNGSVAGAEDYKRSLEINNVNLWWGLVLLCFGLAMLGLAWWAAASTKSDDAEK